MNKQGEKAKSSTGDAKHPEQKSTQRSPVQKEAKEKQTAKQTKK